MLKKVEIQNFALIESATFTPGKHFTVISGETGAGKSLLIDALGSLTGKRARREVVRSGCEFARIEAIFSFVELENKSDILQEFCEENELILSREIYADGGSQARINGRLVNLSLLRNLSKSIIGLHAQHEQQAIFSLNEQRNLLDKYAGKKLSLLMKDWQKLLSKRKTLLDKIKEYGLNPSERERQLDLLNYQIAEIREADLKFDEDEKLLERNKVLSALSRMKEDLIYSRELLSADSEEGASSLIAKTVSLLDYSAKHSKKIKEHQNSLKQLAFETSQIAINLENSFRHLEAEPNEIEQINRRLDIIDKMKIKYGNSIEEILEFLSKAERRLQTLKQSEELFEKYRKDILQNEKDMEKIADDMHTIRVETGLVLSENICQALSKLEMPDVKFSVDVEKIDKNNKGYYSKFGRDKIEFLIQPNPGEPLMPLNQIASGGEVSRILLAIKSIFGISDDLSLLIFDEIDSGVSGKTAISVAEMLRDLASDKQVLCVSHMAQVAAAADTHYLIDKQIVKDRTQTRLSILEDKARIREISRLVSGNQEDSMSLELAEKMLVKYPVR
ncbi:MAG TPA: DNA repair protein RecN [Candidatus Eisenbacteria bacterium]|nr:DNA repair protein RecN [Candidatus Eisenbacteria bacterium]